MIRKTYLNSQRLGTSLVSRIIVLCIPLFIGAHCQYYDDESSSNEQRHTCATTSSNNTSSCQTDLLYTTGQYQKPAHIIQTINTAYGEPQVILNIFSEETRQILDQTQAYITQHETWESTCQNKHHLCSYWAATGECHKNERYMELHCAPTCHRCRVPEENPQELDPTKKQEVQLSLATNLQDSAILVATSFGEAQYLPTVNADPVVQTIARATRYMQHVFSNETFATVKTICQNKHSMCSLWASQGECDKNPSYMTVMCAPSCQTCERITYEYRCPFDPKAPTILNPGDLDRLFERIIRDFPHWTPTVLAQPPEQPWILQLDTFATAAECDRLIQFGHQLGYNSSVTVGRQRADGTVEAVVSGSVRTSTNAWCQGTCQNDPIVKPLLQRIENLLEIPQNNSEFLQLLRYEEGQFYRKHHDYLDHHKNRPQGVRILTLFLYLNDVEEGGETRFSNLGIDIQPRRGRVVLWPSVLNEDPNVKDIRTEHEALMVRKGIKFAANAWIHQRDYVTPHFANCA